MTTIGITGGIGSGKTTVCRMLEELGARVFYADLEARRITEEDPGARAEIMAVFGAGSYVEGRLDRAYLASQVFGSPERLARLNAIVHPRVYESFAEVRAEAEREGVGLLVKEAALIFETGGERFLDAVVVVDAPEEMRLARAVARDGVTPEQVQARMRNQLPAEELRARADYVIENTGTVEDLRREAEGVYRRFRGC